MGLITGADVTFSWGTVTFALTSLSVDITASGEVDITSMSSITYNDPENTGKKFIHKDFDCPISECEIRIDFFAEDSLINGQNPNKWVGLKKNLTVGFQPNDGSVKFLSGGPSPFHLNSMAVLTNFSLTDSVGEFVRGSATFRLSED
jgi:hypothetical protein